MHTNHNSICLIDIDLITIYDMFSHFSKTKYICILYCMCFYFDLLAQIYSTYSINIYDLGKL